MDEEWKDIAALCSQVLDGTAPKDKVITKTTPLHLQEFTGQAEHDYPILCRMVEAGANVPSSALTNFLKHKCRIELERGDMKSAALSLLYSQGVMIMHNALQTLSKGRVKREEAVAKVCELGDGNKTMKKAVSQTDMFLDEEELNEEDKDAELERTAQLRRTILNVQTESLAGSSRLQGFVSELPPTWKVVQISVEPTEDVRFRKEAKTVAMQENCSLLITSFLCGEMDATMGVDRVPAMNRGGKPSLLKELREVVQLHKMIYKDKADKVKYAAARADMQDRMKGFLLAVEDYWLCECKVLLLGRPKENKRVDTIQKEIKTVLGKLKLKLDENVREGLLFSLYDGASLLSEEQMVRGMGRLAKKKTDIKALVKAAKAFGASNPSTVVRHPISLILDTAVQEIPWETLPMMKIQPVARSPSVFFLCALYQTHQVNSHSVPRTGVRNNQVYYVLNPNQDLPRTEQKLIKPFQTELSLGTGKVGAWPTGEEFQNALSEKDAFMYCGHGAVMKTITASEIERLNVRAATLMFGCNSGKLEQLGRVFDPTGTATAYMLASAPSLLGFLWSVTDVDLDTWTVDFLRLWLGEEREFVEAAAVKRGSFQQMMNSAALVVYGLPSIVDRK